jgi:hypothetical protein
MISVLLLAGMMETIFTKAANRQVEVEIERTIGRGNEVCEKPSISRCHALQLLKRGHRQMDAEGDSIM